MSYTRMVLLIAGLMISIALTGLAIFGIASIQS